MARRKEGWLPAACGLTVGLAQAVLFAAGPGLLGWLADWVQKLLGR